VNTLLFYPRPEGRGKSEDRASQKVIASQKAMTIYKATEI